MFPQSFRQSGGNVLQSFVTRIAFSDQVRELLGQRFLFLGCRGQSPDLERQLPRGFDALSIGELAKRMQSGFDLRLGSPQTDGTQQNKCRQQWFHANSIIFEESAMLIQSTRDTAPISLAVAGCRDKSADTILRRTDH